MEEEESSHQIENEIAVRRLHSAQSVVESIVEKKEESGSLHQYPRKFVADFRTPFRSREITVPGLEEEEADKNEQAHSGHCYHQYIVKLHRKSLLKARTLHAQILAKLALFYTLSEKMAIFVTAMSKRLLIFSTTALIFALSCSNSVKRYGIEVVAEYPHDTCSYTQGLFFVGDDLYESTGSYGKSTFRKVDLESGWALERVNFPEEYFGEGSVFFSDRFYFLTWENRKVFTLDPSSLEITCEMEYPRQGWGLTTDGRSLITSDGSSRIYFLDKDLNLEKKIIVRQDKRQIKWLNELEWIDGKIWANVYVTDNIVIINPRSGNVEGIIDLKGLLPKELRTQGTDVLNGIAYNDKTGKIYVTGKNWPRLYEIKLVRK